MANIKSVKELVLDEQKLVTYVSLCKELCVHVNESKTLLSLAVEEIKKKQPDITLNVNFLISGLLNDNSARTLVCSETDLDTEKKKFRTVFFQHIYSVSQGLSGVGNAAIVAVNRFEDFTLCTGLIKSDSCTKRTSDEIEKLKSKSQAAIDAHITAPLKKDKSKDKVLNGAENKSVVKAHTTKSEPNIKSEVTSPKKDTYSSSNASNGKLNKNEKKPNKGFAGIFSKANSAPSIKPVKAAQENCQEKTPAKSEEKKTKVEVKEMDVDIEDKEVPVKKIKDEPVSASKGTSKKNSLSKIKKTAQVDKKRKRVLHVSDSESDEDPFADNKPALQESDDEIPPTPLSNTVKITSGILNPKKRRKIVDKTYTDEDGYVLTRKEEIYESCSEDEVVMKQPDVKVEKENVKKENKVTVEVSPTKEKKAKITKKKISPPQKGKQATMTSFFKKI